MTKRRCPTDLCNRNNLSIKINHPDILNLTICDPLILKSSNQPHHPTIFRIQPGLQKERQPDNYNNIPWTASRANLVSLTLIAANPPAYTTVQDRMPCARPMPSITSIRQWLLRLDTRSALIMRMAKRPATPLIRATAWTTTPNKRHDSLNPKIQENAFAWPGQFTIEHQFVLTQDECRREKDTAIK